MQLLAVCGSLRAVSTNGAVVEALARCSAGLASIIVYDGLNGLPHFNPDLDTDAVPAPVAQLRRLVGESDGLIICSPEYAHGVPGSLKNALDWLVASLEFPATPVALINTSPRAHHAQDQLREILTTMSARIVDQASITLPLSGRTVTVDSILGDADLSSDISTALSAFIDAIAVLQSETPSNWT